MQLNICRVFELEYFCGKHTKIVFKICDEKNVFDILFLLPDISTYINLSIARKIARKTFFFFRLCRIIGIDVFFYVGYLPALWIVDHYANVYFFIFNPLTELLCIRLLLLFYHHKQDITYKRASLAHG